MTAPARTCRHECVPPAVPPPREAPGAVRLLRRGDRVVAVAPWAGGVRRLDPAALTATLSSTAAVGEQAYLVSGEWVVVVRPERSLGEHRTWLAGPLRRLLDGRVPGPGIGDVPVHRGGERALVVAWRAAQGLGSTCPRCPGSEVS